MPRSEIRVNSQRNGIYIRSPPTKSDRHNYFETFNHFYTNRRDDATYAILLRRYGGSDTRDPATVILFIPSQLCFVGYFGRPDERRRGVSDVQSFVTRINEKRDRSSCVQRHSAFKTKKKKEDYENE